MELKIRCECEQKIAFDAEPVDGHLGFELKCPNCGTVLNDQADAEIAARLASSPEERTVTSEAGTGAPAPAATRSGGGDVTVPVPGSGTKLRMAPRPEPVHREAPSAAPKPFSSDPASAKIKPAIQPVFADPDMKKSVLGAVIGSTLAVGVWFALYKATGAKWGVLAIAVGWFAGFGARWIGRSEGPRMAMAVAGVALGFIIAFQAYRANDEMWGFTHGAGLDEMYQEEVDEAKQELAAVPTGSDSEIRAWWTKLAAEDGEPIDPNSITPAELKEYRETAWQRQKSLADGTLTKEMYQKEMNEGLDEMKQSPVFRIIFWVKALGIFNIVAIAIGVGSAWKFGNGAG